MASYEVPSMETARSKLRRKLSQSDTATNDSSSVKKQRHVVIDLCSPSSDDNRQSSTNKDDMSSTSKISSSRYISSTNKNSTTAKEETCSRRAYAVLKPSRVQKGSTTSLTIETSSTTYVRDNTQTKTMMTNNNPILTTTSLPVQANPSSTNKRCGSTNDALWNKSQYILKTKFQISSLRSLQPMVVRHVLTTNTSCIVVMATGAGKSLCYQLPAATFDGLTLVVSPLIALMIDQVQSLNKRGIPAELLSSTARTNAEQKTIMDHLLSSNTTLKLLYCTPELMVTDKFRSILRNIYKRNQLSLIAIDEAHTLSSWGHDFRPAYRKLSWLRQSFPDIPCIACTATATPKVIEDLRSCLLMKEEPCFKASFNRPNISYSVRFKDTLNLTATTGGAMHDLLSVIKEQHKKAMNMPCSGIIYVHKRSDTTLLANQINTRMDQGIKAAPYHAGLNDAIRKQTQHDWTEGKIQIAVATIAFGMGIDLPHVRYVIHWTLAKSVEGFYQESGRAGRDGKLSSSILYYSKEDVSKFTYLIKMTERKKKNHDTTATATNTRSLDALQGMVHYCINSKCRRKYLLKHFGEEEDDFLCKKTCDYCQNPSKVEEAIQASHVAKEVAASVAAYGRTTSKGNTKNDWDGQWDRAHGDVANSDDDNNYYHGDEDCWNENDDTLNITTGGTTSSTTTNYHNTQNNKQGKITGFAKASSILSKYEMLECQSGQTNGFVKFKSKNPTDFKSKNLVAPTIPDHLRANANNLPEPFLYQNKESSSVTMKSSDDINSELGNVKDRLAKLKEARAARLAAVAKESNCK